MKRSKTRSDSKVDKNYTWHKQVGDALLQLKQKLKCDAKENKNKRRTF